MANNCWNWVLIEGDNDTLDLLENRMQDYDKFDNLTDWTNYILGEERYTYPKDSPYDVTGTRWWDIDWNAMDRDNESMTLQGDSAWSPPIHLMELLAKEFDLKILIEYEESGCDFGGYCKFDSTGQTEDYTVSYDQWRYEQDSDAYFEQFKFYVNEDHYDNEQDVIDSNDFVSKEDLKELIQIYKNERKQEVQS